MHRLSELHIKNFRACKNVSLPLEGYTPLVGQNNTGKSTILEAIKWVLKPFALSESDFGNSGQPVVISARVEGISSDILSLVPNAKHRAAIEPFCVDGFLWIRAVASEAGTGAKKIEKQVYDPSQYSGVGLPADDGWREYPTGLPQAVSALLPEALHIEAMDDVGEDLGKSKSGSTIKNLLDEIMGPVLQAHDDLSEALSTIRHILTTDGSNRSSHLQTFDEQASKTLNDFFPGLSISLDLQVVDIKEFFKAGDLHITDKLTGDRRRFDQLGTGAQRSIQMSLIRYLAEVKSATQENPARRLLLIDEPELYLHPQGIRRLREALDKLSQKGFQIVFSTHSPLMLNRENAADKVIVRKKKEEGVITQKPLRRAVQAALSDAPSQSRTIFELGNVAEIYFSDRVIICEGKTDSRLLPLAYERINGYPMELDQTTMISLGGCENIPKAMKVLDSMGIAACAIADLDFAFTGARKSGMLPKDGDDLIQARAVLQRLQPEHGFFIAGNGLPQNKGEWTAADAWAVVAHDSEGRKIADYVHTELKGCKVWVWPTGDIERVTGSSEKGEDAIIKQEEQLRAMSCDQIVDKMPYLKACFEWIRNL